MKLGHPYSFKKVFPTAKHFEFKEYVQHSKTTTAILENLLRNTAYPNLFAVTVSYMKTRPYLVNCTKTPWIVNDATNEISSPVSSHDLINANQRQISLTGTDYFTNKLLGFRKNNRSVL